VLWVNCRSVYNKASEYSNLVVLYNPGIGIGTESWLKEIIRTLRSSLLNSQPSEGIGIGMVGGGGLICVKNFIACMELWAEEDAEVVAVKVKGMNSKHLWEVVGVYGAPDKDVLVS
jgi:hypothetical protein